MKNFDEKIRDKLFDAEMPVSDGIWDAIEQNIERKDNRPTSWFFLLTLLIGLPSLLLSYYLVDSDNLNSTAESKQNSYTSDSDQWVASFENYYDSNMAYIANEGEERSSLAPVAELNSKKLNPFKFNYQTNQNLSFQIASTKTKRYRPIEGFDKLTNKTARNIASLSKESDTSSELTFADLFSNKTECPDFNKSWPGFYVYGQAGSYFPFEKLSSPQNEMSRLVEERKLTESGLPSFTFDLGAGYEFHNGLFVQAGIMFNRTNIKFLHRQEDIINTQTSIVIDTIFNSSGQVVAINKDTSVIHEYGVREVSGTNKFNTIDIPLWLGYAHAIDEKHNIRASLGVAFNLTSNSSGKMIDYDGEPYNYSDDNNPMFKTKFGISYLASLSYETKLTDRFSFDAGLNMRYFSKNINLETNPVDQKFINLGLSAGIRYRI